MRTLVTNIIALVIMFQLTGVNFEGEATDMAGNGFIVLFFLWIGCCAYSIWKEFD